MAGEDPGTERDLSPRARPNARAIAVLLVDPFLVARLGFCLLLRLHGRRRFITVADLGRAADALAAASERRPDIAVLAGDPYPAGGERLVSTLQRTCPVVMYIGEQDAAFARRALDAGATAVVCMQEPFEELLNALRAAVRGHTHISPGLARANDPKLGSLTPHQAQYLWHTTHGRRSHEIAALYGVSPGTVRHHLCRARRRFDVPDVPALAARVTWHAQAGWPPYAPSASQPLGNWASGEPA